MWILARILIAILVVLASVTAVAAPMTTSVTAKQTDRPAASDLHIRLSAMLDGRRKRIKVTAATITGQPDACGESSAAKVTTSGSSTSIEWPKACVPMNGEVMVDITYETKDGATVTSKITWTSTLSFDNHPTLTWDDFQPLSEPPPGTEEGTEAETLSGWSPSSGSQNVSEPVPVEGGYEATSGYTDVSAEAYFATRGSASPSWVEEGKQTPGLLSHEQGHYDISQIFALKYVVKVSAISFKGTGATPREARNAAIRGAKAAKKKIFGEMQSAEKKAQKRYDSEEETDHGMNDEKQAEWKANIDACLAALQSNVGSQNYTIPEECQDVC